MLNKSKFLFIHIPKCAGISITNVIVYQNDVDVIGHHAKYAEIFSNQQRNRSDYIVFSFIRNPWDRLVSTFHYMMQGGRSEIDVVRRDKYLYRYHGSFEKFVLDIDRWIDIVEEESIYVDRYIPHFRPQYEFIVDSESNQLAVDFIGKVENIKTDLTRFANQHQLKLGKVEKSNRSKRRHYSTYYSPTTRDLVAKHYERDVELGDYCFEKNILAKLTGFNLALHKR